MSQFDGETREIDGCKYQVFMLGPMVSHDLLMDLAKMVGPAMGPVMDVVLSGVAAGRPVAELNLDAGFFTKAATMLFAGLDKATLKNIINTLADSTHVDGKPLKPMMDIHFRGRLHVMYAWLAFAMEAQWSKSLSALVGAVQARSARLTGTASPSQHI